MRTLTIVLSALALSLTISPVSSQSVNDHGWYLRDAHSGSFGFSGSNDERNLFITVNVTTGTNLDGGASAVLYLFIGDCEKPLRTCKYFRMWRPIAPELIRVTGNSISASIPDATVFCLPPTPEEFDPCDLDGFAAPVAVDVTFTKTAQWSEERVANTLHHEFQSDGSTKISRYKDAGRADSATVKGNIAGYVLPQTFESSEWQFAFTDVRPEVARYTQKWLHPNF